VTITLETAKPRSRFANEMPQPEIVFDPTGIVVAPKLILIWESGNLPLSVLPDGTVVLDDGYV
jgi:hypothetical protein